MPEPDGVLIQKIEYYRMVRPPSLKQYVYRRAVKEIMTGLKGQTGVSVNSETKNPNPVSALVAKEQMKGLKAETLIAEHPDWVEEYRRLYGNKDK